MYLGYSLLSVWEMLNWDQLIEVGSKRRSIRLHNSSGWEIAFILIVIRILEALIYWGLLREDSIVEYIGLRSRIELSKFSISFSKLHLTSDTLSLYGAIGSRIVWLFSAIFSDCSVSNRNRYRKASISILEQLTPSGKDLNLCSEIDNKWGIEGSHQMQISPLDIAKLKMEAGKIFPYIGPMVPW